MSTLISAPANWVEEISNLRLSPRADERLQTLMDRNNEGQLSTDQREELAALAELSERIALVRADAYALLGRRPQ
jgi:hypothetical protein